LFTDVILRSLAYDHVIDVVAVLLLLHHCVLNAPYPVW